MYIYFTMIPTIVTNLPGVVSFRWHGSVPICLSSRLVASTIVKIRTKSPNKDACATWRRARLQIGGELRASYARNYARLRYFDANERRPWRVSRGEADLRLVRRRGKKRDRGFPGGSTETLVIVKLPGRIAASISPRIRANCHAGSMLFRKISYAAANCVNMMRRGAELEVGLMGTSKVAMR